MKLSKLYADKPKFKPIEFNDGVNIIIGRINNFDLKNTNCHNLGKSLIVRIIDYMLLKDPKKGSIFDNDIFKNYTFFLEIHLNNGKYVTIMRSPANKLVSMKIHNLGKQTFTVDSEWDYYNLRVSTTSPKYESAQDVLQKLLNFDILKNIKYRNSLTYFLRGQEDYNDPFLLEKYKRGQDKYWKPILLELMGYNGELLSEIYSLNEKISSLDSEIEILKQSYNVSENELDRFQEIKKVLEGKIQELSTSADSFDFYLREAKISDEVVKEIESKISALNTYAYSIKKEIQSLNDSLEMNIAFDYDEVNDLYQEMSILFPNGLQKSYEELLEFNKKISNDRRVKLQDLLTEKNSILQKTNIELMRLNEKRVEILKQLKEIETFQKFKDAQREIVHLKVRLSETEEKIKIIRKIEEINKERERTIQKLESDKQQLKNQIEEGTETGRKIKKKFSAYIKAIIGSDAVLSFETVKTGNINFRYDFINSVGETTNANRGHTYMKEICACMDLAIINNYINNSYYRFAFHDGCLDGDDPRFAVAYLDLIKALSNEGVQCIVTLIDSVIPRTQDGSTYSLDTDDIVLELNDNPDGSGKLFGFNF